MIQVLENNINLCDSCKNRDDLPYCPANENDILYGTGIGNDNICCCNKYCADVVDRKTGKWLFTQDDEHEYCTCSECGYGTGENWMIGREIPYCEMCGSYNGGKYDV